MTAKKPQPPRSPWSKAMQDVLADGGWHPLPDLIAAASKVIPPGVAWRRAERHRVRSLKDRTKGQGEAQPRRSGDEHSAIEVGCRMVAKDILRALVLSGRVDRDGDLYRFAPPKEEEEATG